MKGWTKTGLGWIFELKGGPAAGHQYRLGFALPGVNKGRYRLPDEVHARGGVYVPHATGAAFKTDTERDQYNDCRPMGMPLDEQIEYRYSHTTTQ